MKIINDNDLFKYTKRVSFELSNSCNFSKIHKVCPLYLEHEPKTLPAKIVYKTIDILSEFKFNKRIAFHVYNEPLIDPRLFKFIEYARKNCPNCDIYFSTNGVFLDQILLDELIESGLSSIHISAYSKKEFERFSKIKFSIQHDIAEAVLIQDFLEIYKKPIINLNSPCFAPLSDITITRDGRISLCCKDWSRAHNLGNLNENDLYEILKSGELHEVYNRLSSGDRYLDLCSRCGSTR